MRLLVSLYSRTQEWAEALVLVDPSARAVRPVPIPDPAYGAAGLCLGEDTVYCVVDRGRPAPDEPELSDLYALDVDTLGVRWRHRFRVARDVHSLAASAAGVYAVSTGTDEVVELRVDRQGVLAEGVWWRAHPAGERSDRHHLNAIAPIDGRLLICGFGPRPPSGWRDARDGFVRALPTGEHVAGPLYHPHSLCRLDNGVIAVCESPRRRVVTSDGRRSPPLAGYARGLCLADGGLYAGTSQPRSPGILPHDSAGAVDGACSLCRLDPRTLALEDVILLDDYGREVYDVLAIPAPASDPASRRRSRGGRTQNP